MLENIFNIFKKLFNRFLQKEPKLPLANSKEDENTIPTHDEPASPSTEDKNISPTKDKLARPPTKNENTNPTHDEPASPSAEDKNIIPSNTKSFVPQGLWGPKDEKDLSDIIANYIYALGHLQDPDTIKTALPYPSYQNLSLFKGIIEHLKSEIEIWNQSISIEHLKSEIEIWNQSISEELQEIQRLEKIIQICEEIIRQITSTTPQQTPVNPIDKSVKLIFATSSSNRVRFMEDLDLDSNQSSRKKPNKKTPADYLRIKELLNNVINYKTLAGNNQKYKILTSTNVLLQDVREVKDGQYRIYFKPLNAYCVYIYMFRQKKSNWSMADSQALINRVSNQYAQYQNIKRRLNSKSGNNIDEILRRHAEIKKAIFAILDCQSKGENKDELQLK